MIVRARTVLAAALAAALVVGLAAPVQPALAANSNSSNLNNQIQAAGEDLDNANAVVKKALTDYNIAQAALVRAQTALNVANSAAANAQAADARAGAELGSAQARTDAAAQKLAATQSKLDGEHRLVTELIQQVYRNGPLSQLDALLSATSPEDLTQRLEIIQTWTRSKQATISNLTVVKTLVTKQKLQLQMLEAQLQVKKDAVHASAIAARDAALTAQKAKATYDAAARVQAAALKVAQSHRDEVKKRYEALKAEQARLQAQAKQGSKLGSGLTFTGELLWPTTSHVITEGPGPRIHPVYGYKSCHTGIDIGAGYGQPIYAAADGIVVSVLNGGPYGLHTLLAHGSGLTTLYAHQSATLVKAGEHVKRGQVIGKVGATGWVTGPHLHFEVRIDGTAYDPRGWFGGRKVPIRC